MQFFNNILVARALLLFILKSSYKCILPVFALHITYKLCTYVCTAMRIHIYIRCTTHMSYSSGWWWWFFFATEIVKLSPKKLFSFCVRQTSLLRCHPAPIVCEFLFLCTWTRTHPAVLGSTNIKTKRWHSKMCVFVW